jgi:acyl-coenzyme A thioesterase PaaI-like protein
MPLHIGRTTSLWNVEITDEDNNMVCRVTFTAMYKDIKK